MTLEYMLTSKKIFASPKIPAQRTRKKNELLSIPASSPMRTAFASAPSAASPQGDVVNLLAAIRDVLAEMGVDSAKPQ